MRRKWKKLHSRAMSADNSSCLPGITRSGYAPTSDRKMSIFTNDRSFHPDRDYPRASINNESVNKDCAAPGASRITHESEADDVALRCARRRPSFEFRCHHRRPTLSHNLLLMPPRITCTIDARHEFLLPWNNPHW